jgi:hypothetical protein
MVYEPFAIDARSATGVKHALPGDGRQQGDDCRQVIKGIVCFGVDSRRVSLGQAFIGVQGYRFLCHRPFSC